MHAKRQSGRLGLLVVLMVGLISACGTAGMAPSPYRVTMPVLDATPMAVRCQKNGQPARCKVVLETDWAAVVRELKAACLALGGSDADCLTDERPLGQPMRQNASIAFADRSSCVVQGYVYVMPGETADFRRADSCPDVRTEIRDNALLLYSPRVWVLIVLPVQGGHQRFVYHWGSALAHIGPQEWPVSYGPIQKG